jgi:hypothetical protein
MTASRHKERLFDLEQANRALPLVSRITQDIVRANRSIRSLHQQARQFVARGRQEEAERLHDQIQALASECAEFILELEKIGCELKDPGSGLVDFPARLGGRKVYLCWKLGESRVAHWHELHAGFVGRQPADGLAFSGGR